MITFKKRLIHVCADVTECLYTSCLHCNNHIRVYFLSLIAIDISFKSTNYWHFLFPLSLCAIGWIDLHLHIIGKHALDSIQPCSKAITSTFATKNNHKL